MAKRPRYSAHPDANQAEIIELVKAAMPCLIDDVSNVASTHDIEVWAYDVHLDMWRWTHWEIKTSTGKLTKAQRKRMSDWPGSVLLARDANDILREYGRIQ